MEIKIRTATVDDARLLANMGAETFFDAYAAELPAEQLREFLPTVFSLEIQTAELADPNTVFFIAEVDTEAAGYAMLREDSPPKALADMRIINLPRIYLRPKFIGLGLGSTVMKTCFQEAKRRGFEAVWLQVWERNGRARVFYERWGFIQVGTIDFQFGAETQTDLVLFRLVE